MEWVNEVTVKEQSGLPEKTKSLLGDFDMLMVTDDILYRNTQEIRKFQKEYI